MPYKRILLTFVLVILSWFSVFSSPQARRPFTVADEIGLWLFIPDMDRPNPRFSPDRNYFAVYSERGRSDLNRPEYSLRLYRSAEVENFLKHPNDRQPPAPVWIISLATDKDGPIIHNWRWLPDSSGVAFLQRINGHQQLVLGDLRTKKLEALTSATEDAEDFDVRDPDHFVYTAADSAELKKIREKKETDRHAMAVVGTGRHLGELLMPDDPVVMKYFSSARNCLWAVQAGKRFEVKHDTAQIFPKGDLVLSPDGSSLVTTLPVAEVPKSWETLYPAPTASSPNRIRAGKDSAKQYVRIVLGTGSVQPLTGAPLSSDAGWPAEGTPDWSSDGQAVVLPGTFIKLDEDKPSRPCTAFVDLPRGMVTCIEELKAANDPASEDGRNRVSGVQFVHRDKRRVLVSFSTPNGRDMTTEYQQMPDGKWQRVAHATTSLDSGYKGLEVAVKQGIDQPPLLIASRESASRVIWDPNPQLKSIELGQATVYQWKDKQGREFKGGLFKPVNYAVGRRYPLVIQTHGFDESFFFPSGPGMPTAFAATALAAAGIVVLQVNEDCPFMTPKEGPCAASAYESAVSRLVLDGLVDPERVGIIGFSRSCYYVMETLTTSSLHIKAASITSGLMFDYWQHMLSPEGSGGDAIIGAPPFGEGLQQWLKHSPGFNLDKIGTPLMVVGQGPDVLLTMWAAYSGLRQLHKPVELVMLNSDEHVLTNPAMRVASQGGSVDWFRFWLQDYEGADPAKAEQYKRWRALKKMQMENEKAAGECSRASVCGVPTCVRGSQRSFE